MQTNVEIKAAYDDHDHVRSVLAELDADVVGTDLQTDTYFNVPDGRLKLREGTIERYLVHYRRDDEDGPKESDIQLYETGEDATALKETLTAALGVDVVVEKTREIYFIDNVKFHIDEVDDLGTFIEIEALNADGDRSVEELYEQCEHYMNELGVEEDDLVPVSYSDMLRQR